MEVALLDTPNYCVHTFSFPLAVEAPSKEIKVTLVFKSAACMQIAVLAQGHKTVCSKEMSSPAPQKSPEKMGTHNIFLLLWLFSLFWPALFKF